MKTEIKRKTDKELFQMVLDNFWKNPAVPHICCKIDRLFINNDISLKEYRKMDTIMENSKHIAIENFGAEDSYSWWDLKSESQKLRFEFVKHLISIL